MQDRADVKMLPPVIPLVGLGLGLLVHLAAPIGLGLDVVTLPLGLVMVGTSVLLVIFAARELAKARTSFDIRKNTTALVKTGVFRLSRNPVYLSMMLLCFGLALLADSLPMVLLSIPIGSALCLLVIRPEERYLERKFGSDFLAYRSAVRRWI